MVAHSKDREGYPVVTDPVARDADGNVVEPHIGSVYSTDPKPTPKLTGYVRGGTSNPTRDQSGDVEYLDPDGRTVATRPSMVHRRLPDGVNVRSDAQRSGAWTDDDPETVQRARAERTSDTHPDIVADASDNPQGQKLSSSGSKKSSKK